MTQPIQEPSTQRSVSGLDWGQSQLARRPAPVGSSKLPSAWMDMATPITIPSGSPTGVGPFQTSAGDTSLFIPDLTSGILDVANTGVYLVSAQVEWATTGFDYAVAVVTTTSGTLFPTLVGEQFISASPSYGLPTPVAQFFQNLAGGGSDNGFGVTVYQTTGSSKTLNSCFLGATYLGDLP